MPPLEILPFADEHLDAAAELLAARHARHRATEPLLPARFEHPAAARIELEAAWRKDGASGAVVLAAGRITGYLIGAPRPDSIWGANVWVELAGHAVEEPELARDLYGAAAGRWADAGSHRHYVLAPASDASLVEAWFHVGFGMQHVHAIRELPHVASPDPSSIPVGEAEERDIDDLIAIAPLLAAHQALAPVFGGIHEEDPDELRAGRATNLLSSRFWPRRGFRPTFYRLFRAL